MKRPRKKKEPVSITTEDVGKAEDVLITEVSKEEKPAKEKPIEEHVKEEKLIVAEPPKKPKSSGMVKIKVLVGTLSYEGGTYEKGETFTVARKRLEGFNPRFFKIIE